MSANQQLTFTALVNIAGATGPLQQLQQQFGATGSAASQSQTGFNSFSNSANQSSTAAKGTTTSITPLSGALAGAGTQARTTVGAMSPLGGAMKETATGGLALNNTLQPMPGMLNQTSTAASGATQQHTSWTSALKNNALALSVVASSAIGLISGITGLESAHIALERAQLRVNTSSLAVQKAQDNYNKAVAKFGPDSRPAQEALANLQNKTEANRVAQDRAQVMQAKFNESLGEFASNIAPSVITLGGSIAQVMTTMRGATLASSTANEALAGSSTIAAAAETAVGGGAATAAAGEDVASVATMGLGARFALIAAPIAAALILFALIETNTFGMGDAFRSTVDVIAGALTNFVNNVTGAASIIVSAFTGLVSIFGQIGASLSAKLQIGFAGIANWFLDNVINPIIGFWNNLNLGLQLAWADTVNKLISAFAPVVVNVLGAVKVIAQGFGLLPGAAGEAFRNVVTQLDPMIKGFQNAGTTGASSADQIRTKFQGIDTLKHVTVDVQDQGVAFGVLQRRFAGVTDASGHLVASQNSLGGQIIQNTAETVKYYSHGENLQKLLAGPMSTATKTLGGLFAQLSGVMGGAASATDNATASQTKHAAAVKQTAGAYEQFYSKLKSSQADQAAATANTLKAVAANQYVTQAVLDSGTAYAEAAKKYETLSGSLSNGTAVLNRYNTAVIEGKNKFMEFIKSTQDAVVTQKEYTTELDNAVGKQAIFNGVIEKTPPNLELVGKALLGDSDALKQLQDELNKTYEGFFKLGDEVAGKLGDALAKGHKAWNKELKDLSKDTGISLDELKNNFGLKVAAGLDQANNTLKTGLGVMINAIKGGAPLAGSAIEEWISKMQSQISGASPQLVGQWNKVFVDLRAIAAAPIGTAAFSTAIGNLQRDMKGLNIPMADVNTLLSKLPGGLNQTGTAAGTATPPITSLAAQISAAKTVTAVWATTLTGVVTLFGTAFTGAVNIANIALVGITKNIGIFIVGMVTGFQQGLTATVNVVVSGFKSMFTVVNKAAVDMTATIQAFVRTGLIDSLQKGVTQATAAVNTGFSKMSQDIAGYTKTMTATIQSFVRTGLINSLEQGVAQAQTRVATAFNAMLSTVRSTTGQMISQINNLKSAILSIPTSHNTVFTGDVRSLSSAVSQAKSLISSVPTTHNTTLTITTIQRVVQQVVPFSGAPASGSGEYSAITEVGGFGGVGGGVGGSGSIARIIQLLEQLVNKEEIVEMDGKEVGRLVRRHIFEGIT